MNKKGASILMMIAEILVVLGISAMIIFAAKDFAQSERVHKTILAQDIEMMLSIFSGLSGNAVVAYPQDVSAYTIVVGSDDGTGQVTIFKEGDTDAQKITQDFPLPDGYTADGLVEEEAQLCLEKSGKRLLVRACREDETLEVPTP